MHHLHELSIFTAEDRATATFEAIAVHALTDEGEVIYRAALRLLANIETFRAEVNEVRQQISGHLTLALFDKTATNPAAKIGAAIRALDVQAPDITLEIFTEPLNAIEQGVQEGRFQIGLGPMHKPMPGLAYYPLFDEPMSLYCGSGNPLYGKRNASIDAQALKSVRYAGLAYRSPNMDVSRDLGLTRSATVYDQESIATLILSGRYIGFLPDHYADGFVRQRKMRRIAAGTHRYTVEFAAVVRDTPRLSRMTSLFLECLREAHGVNDGRAGKPLVAAAGNRAD